MSAMSPLDDDVQSKMKRRW